MKLLILILGASIAGILIAQLPAVWRGWAILTAIVMICLRMLWNIWSDKS